MELTGPDLPDLKIDWIWHLLLKIEAGVIGPTLLYFRSKITFFTFLFRLHPYSKYKWNKNAKNVIYNVIYLLKYSKVGQITCIVCHVNSKSVVHLLVDAISSLFSDQCCRGGQECHICHISRMKRNTCKVCKRT